MGIRARSVGQCYLFGQKRSANKLSDFLRGLSGQTLRDDRNSFNDRNDGAFPQGFVQDATNALESFELALPQHGKADDVFSEASLRERLEAKGLTLCILAMNIDAGSATRKLMMNVLGSVAGFELDMMLERQREGLAKAKDKAAVKGVYRGRQPTARRKRIRYWS